ncbi:hypothetical protein CSAL01_09069 [Colletotrichum salicis]|uniref:Uncharacterized protein n=1 Tax=Colletotrichum salicis TaxID=1209931 RepID=A0A135UI81_9PEZI|nr:hypothetical protein CSAL01_09069 [Colletotrichum salicis]
MDSQDSQMPKKRKLDDDNGAAPAGENGGNRSGVTWGCFRPLAIEFGHEASCIFGGHNLEIWATDAQGAKRQIGRIWDFQGYCEAEQAKIIAKPEVMGPTSPLTLAALRLVRDRQEEKARQKEEETRQKEEEACQKEKKVL